MRNSRRLVLALAAGLLAGTALAGGSAAAAEKKTRAELDRIAEEKQAAIA